jgi:DNA-3-methyladenine glycosylase I
VAEAAGVQRCDWARDDLSISYHDTEWGVPLHDDRGLFELLILEGAQAGLSWITILKKRPAYRKAFDRFDARKVARYDEAKLAALLADDGIVRNRLKIRAAVQNAQAFLAVQKEFGSFDRYVWQFVGGQPLNSRLKRSRPYRAFRRPEQGSAQARLQIRRLHHLLRLHAGHRDGERPPGQLLLLQAIDQVNFSPALCPDVKLGSWGACRSEK